MDVPETYLSHCVEKKLQSDWVQFSLILGLGMLSTLEWFFVLLVVVDSIEAAFESVSAVSVVAFIRSVWASKCLRGRVCTMLTWLLISSVTSCLVVQSVCDMYGPGVSDPSGTGPEVHRGNSH